jgi:phosphate transport system substrate-binding protein
MVLSMVLAACAPAATPTAAPTEAPAAEPTATEAMAEPTATEAMEEPTAEPTMDPSDPAAYSGDIYTAGSSTVGPVTEAIIEQFVADGFTGQIKNDIIGSGAGFERFCKTGETDVANASRPIKTSEIESCRALSPSREPVGLLVGLDAIAVVVNPENDWVTDVTMDQLNALMTTAVNWSDVDPSWPAEPILRYTPGTDSGTFDFFVEVAIQKPLKIEKLDDAKAVALEASNLNQSEDDNVLVQGIEGNKYAIGYFGYAYYQEAGDKLKALSVNGVAPSAKTAEDGSYALARPLFIYSDAAIMQAKPQVADFIRYYIDNVNSVISQVGYFPASASAFAANRAAWIQAMGK